MRASGPKKASTEDQLFLAFGLLFVVNNLTVEAYTQSLTVETGQAESKDELA